MNIVDKVVFIPICCVCEGVRDTSQGLEQWTSLRSFLRLYRIPQEAYRLSHTYCPRCMEYLGFNRNKSEKRVGHPRGEATQEDIRQRIISVIESAIECDLDTLVSRCGDLSWSQVFSEVDHMSRLGIIRLTRSADRAYRVGAPTSAPAS